MQAVAEPRFEMRGKHNKRRRLTAVIIFAALVAGAVALVILRATTESPAKPAVPDTGSLLGLWIRSDFDANPQSEAWEQREADAGRTFDVAHTFYPFDEQFPTSLERQHADAGRIPLISWNGTDTRAIANGDHDTLIRERAQSVREFESPVFLRFFWEMDGANKAGIARDPETYVEAWRRIHSIYQDEGATNVAFVWCPNAWEFDSRDTARWYPGDDTVDWLCADGYNWAPGKPDAQWLSFETIFDEFYAWAAVRDKPIMIAEFAAQERGTGDKAQWLRDATQVIEADYPNIKAVVYFDEDRRTRGHYDWRLDTSPESYSTWLEIASNPYFSPRD